MFPDERQRSLLRPCEAEMFDDFYMLGETLERQVIATGVCIAFKLGVEQF